MIYDNGIYFTIKSKEHMNFVLDRLAEKGYKKGGISSPDAKELQVHGKDGPLKPGSITFSTDTGWGERYKYTNATNHPDFVYDVKPKGQLMRMLTEEEMNKTFDRGASWYNVGSGGWVECMRKGFGKQVYVTEDNEYGGYRVWEDAACTKKPDWDDRHTNNKSWSYAKRMFVEVQETPVYSSGIKPEYITSWVSRNGKATSGEGIEVPLAYVDLSPIETRAMCWELDPIQKEIQALREEAESMLAKHGIKLGTHK